MQEIWVVPHVGVQTSDMSVLGIGADMDTRRFG